MELKKIVIKNFRSIKDATIEFDQNCKILVGKNDAGKSNVLKAIAAVFDEYKVSMKDRRKRIGNETIQSNDYFVHAVFELNQDDFDDVLIIFKKNYGSLDSFPDLEKNIYDFITKNFKSVLKRILITENAESQETYYSIHKTELKKFENLIFENGTVIKGVPSVNQEIKTVVFNCIKQHWEDYISKCYYWNFDNSFLLPNNINVTEFYNNPDCCLPLKNVFNLCNRPNIAQQFGVAILEDGDYDNLLDQVSQEVTTVFQEIWGDFKNIEIELRHNGNDITIKIKEKVKYNFEDRSDGFKKFISILLMISTRVRNESIDYLDIVLFDEPDQSLYPSSARYLRDELLKLSEKTKIIYSTHSQFMLDSNYPERHIVVEKIDDVTLLKDYDAISPFSNDELLMRAIGTSVFECLKEKNIIFEGWLDKELFEFYLKFNPAKAKKFENVGRVFLSGISSVETLVQILILANKDFVIVADSDETSSKKRVDFSKNYEEFSMNWLGYSDVTSEIQTMEDFLKENYIESKLKAIAPNFKFKPAVSAIKNIENVIPEKNEKQIFKKELISNLEMTHIKTIYSKVIDQVLVLLQKK